MKRILVMDDDPGIRDIFKRFLEERRYEVEVASNGEEGLRLLDATPFDLVVTDIMMPDKDGLEVLMTLRKQRPDLPVIAISGGMHAVPMDFLPMARKFGARRVLYKPVELPDLLAAVRDLLPGDCDPMARQENAV